MLMAPVLTGAIGSQGPAKYLRMESGDSRSSYRPSGMAVDRCCVRRAVGGLAVWVNLCFRRSDHRRVWRLWSVRRWWRPAETWCFRRSDHRRRIS